MQLNTKKKKLMYSAQVALLSVTLCNIWLVRS